MDPLARTLLLLGALLLVLGLLALAAARIGLPLGRLPGDFAWRGKHASVFIPLGTSVLVSIVLSLLLWILGRFRR